MYRGSNDDLFPYALRPIDARLGDLEPLAALSTHPDSPAPLLDPGGGAS